MLKECSNKECTSRVFVVKRSDKPLCAVCRCKNAIRPRISKAFTPHPIEKVISDSENLRLILNEKKKTLEEEGTKEQIYSTNKSIRRVINKIDKMLEENLTKEKQGQTIQNRSAS